MNMDLSVIIVSWNVKEKLRENLKAIFESKTDLAIEVFVVDNHSSDGSAEMVQREFPQARLIANEENFGFAKANNQAIKIAQGRFMLLLNPDMKIFPDTFAGMARWMDDNPQVWVAGCNLINENGGSVRHVRRFPNVGDQLAIVLKIPHIFPGILKRYLMADFDYAKPAKVDSIRGAFFMIRREAIGKIGPLDERYFLWFEEVDYCRQIANAGGEVWYTPAAQCIDFVGQSFGQVPRGMTQIYFRDSMLKYFKKWQPGWQYWILKTAWPVGIAIAMLAGNNNAKIKRFLHFD